MGHALIGDSCCPTRLSGHSEYASHVTTLSPQRRLRLIGEVANPVACPIGRPVGQDHTHAE